MAYGYTHFAGSLQVTERMQRNIDDALVVRKDIK